MNTPKNSPRLPEGMEVVSLDFEVDSSDQDITVTATVAPKGYRGDNPLTFEATLDMVGDRELRNAAQLFSAHIVSRLHEPESTEREVLCDSCVGMCCIKYPEVIVFSADVPALCEATGYESLGQLKAAGIIGGNASFGSVGYLGRAPLPKRLGGDLESNSRCVFLTWTKEGQGRCGIYDHRPYTCRGYTERGCEDQHKNEPRLYKIRSAKDRAPAKRADKKRIDMARYIESQHTKTETMK